MAPVRWQPDRTLHLPPWPIPTLGTAFGRGMPGRCPACGQAHLFAGSPRIVPECASCLALLGTAHADYGPPYFVILITGHNVIPAMLLVQKFGNPTSLELRVIFVPLTLVLLFRLLRPVKGGVLAVLVSIGLLDGAAGPG